MSTFVESGDPRHIELGQQHIQKGKVGCIVLAGGDGTRLGHPGPKGSFPVLGNTTLFDLVLQKAKGRPLAVMTSPSNHDETEKLMPGIPLLTQSTLPALNLNHEPLPFELPNGNGYVLSCFAHSPLYQIWKEGGIDIIQVIPIDNHLPSPFDLNQVGAHVALKADVTLKVIRLTSPEEKVGLVGFLAGKMTVIEYSENPPRDWTLASTGLFSFSMEFVEKVKDQKLPLHLARKTFKGEAVLKQETFLFDLLTFAQNAHALLYPREEVFAPLKTPEDAPKVRALLES